MAAQQIGGPGDRQDEQEGAHQHQVAQQRPVPVLVGLQGLGVALQAVDGLGGRHGREVHDQLGAELLLAKDDRHMGQERVRLGRRLGRCPAGGLAQGGHLVVDHLPQLLVGGDDVARHIDDDAGQQIGDRRVGRRPVRAALELGEQVRRGDRQQPRGVADDRILGLDALDDADLVVHRRAVRGQRGRQVPGRCRIAVGQLFDRPIVLGQRADGRGHGVVVGVQAQLQAEDVGAPERVDLLHLGEAGQQLRRPGVRRPQHRQQRCQNREKNGDDAYADDPGSDDHDLISVTVSSIAVGRFIAKRGRRAGRPCIRR